MLKPPQPVHAMSSSAVYFQVMFGTPPPLLQEPPRCVETFKFIFWMHEPKQTPVIIWNRVNQGLSLSALSSEHLDLTHWFFHFPHSKSNHIPVAQPVSWKLSYLLWEQPLWTCCFSLYRLFSCLWSTRQLKASNNTGFWVMFQCKNLFGVCGS